MPLATIAGAFRDLADEAADAGICLALEATPFSHLLEPYWPDIRAHHRNELVRRGRLVTDRGLRTALTATIPGSRWSGDCLEIDSPQERAVCLGGRVWC